MCKDLLAANPLVKTEYPEILTGQRPQSFLLKSTNHLQV
jgi:hypothetical protein